MLSAQTPRKDLPIRDFKPKRNLGQNFLVDEHAAQRIITACNFNKTDVVLEIGPGLGILTREIARRVQKVIAIEKDKELCVFLNNQFSPGRVEVIHADFLKYPVDLLPKNLKVIGNLPYYISSPIIGKILEHRQHFKSLSISVQWEFGIRMTSEISTKDYSPLSCFVQYYTEPKILFKIKNSSFSPKPKVDSCFMHLSIREKPLYPVNDEALLWSVIHLAFQQRRKTLLNGLSSFAKKDKLKEILDSLNINAQKRPENLTIQDFVNITNALDATHHFQK